MYVLFANYTGSSSILFSQLRKEFLKFGMWFVNWNCFWISVVISQSLTPKMTVSADGCSSLISFTIALVHFSSELFHQHSLLKL